MTALVVLQNGINWLFQTVQMPLVAFLASLLLPASYIAKLLKNQIESRFNGTDE